MKIQDIYPFYPRGRSLLLEAVSILTTEELTLRPPSFANSIGDVLYQLTLQVDQLLNLTLTGKSAIDNPPVLDDLDSLLACLDQVHNQAEENLAALTQDDSDRIYTVSYYRGSVLVEGKYTLSYILWLVLENLLHRRGEIYLLLQAQDLGTPSH